MDYQRMRRTMYKNARFDAATTTERSRRLTEHQRKDGRERDILLRRHIVVTENTSPEKVVKKELTRREKLLQWKARKEVLILAQKANKKPPFIVGSFQSTTIKDIANIPPPKSTTKSVKKTANDQPAKAKKQTSKALEALSRPLDARRITRSQAKLAEQAMQTKSKQPPMSSRGINLKSSGSQKLSIQASFAPANHVFKPPTNLTFPVTPDVMKRNQRSTANRSTRTADLLTVPGVKPLKPSNLLANVSKNTDGNLGNNATENSHSAVKQHSSTQTKRRSTRLATPKDATELLESGESSSKQVKVDTKKVEDKAEDNKENREDQENRVIQRTIARLSIHSPTRAVITTPEPKLEGVVPAQFSPFVVSERGADRHKNRRSRGNHFGSASVEDRQRAQHVERFRLMLDTETKRLLELCNKWENIKDVATKEIPSDAQDMILAAVGQARLLTKDKFQQFKRLVDKFEEGSSQEEKMTVDDLIGFWEMVQLTANGLNKRFKDLSDLQANNWKEEVKVVREKATSVVALRVNNINPEVLKQSKARIREAIAAAKKRQKEQSMKTNDKIFDGGFFKVESPKRREGGAPSQNGPSTPKPARKSLLQQVLTNSANRAVKSPSVSNVSARIRVSLLGRRVSTSRSHEDLKLISPTPALNAVPAKSILKSAKSAKKHTVVFSQSEEGLRTEENFSRQAPRRSLRFSVGTKFDDSAN